VVGGEFDIGGCSVGERVWSVVVEAAAEVHSIRVEESGNGSCANLRILLILELGSNI